MSSTSDSSIKPPESNKRTASPETRSDSPPSKQSKVDDNKDERVDSYEHTKKDTNGITSLVFNDAAPEKSANAAESAIEHDGSGTDEKDAAGGAAMAAAEALASLTGGGNHDTETPCSSRQAIEENLAGQSNRSGLDRSGAPRDAKVRLRQRMRARRADKEEDGEDSLSLSSSSASSSGDDREEFGDSREREDGECSIVAVQMAPELRRSVAMLAHVQMSLEALERKGARLHRRIELKLSRQKRPHLDQRASIALNIPGFWLTAVSF